VNTHDQAYTAHRGIELLEEKRKQKKQGDAHEQEKISGQGDDEMPVPNRFGVRSVFHFFTTSKETKLCSVAKAIQQVKKKFAEDKVLAVLSMGKISEKGIMKEGYSNPAQPARQGLRVL
jgi:hypothetical protein